MTTASFSDFANLDIRVGKIMEVDDIPEARKPLYSIKADFGPLGIKHTAAGLKAFYSKEELKGKLIVAVINFEPKNIAGVNSEFLTLAAVDSEESVILLKPDKDIELGSKIF